MPTYHLHCFPLLFFQYCHVTYLNLYDVNNKTIRRPILELDQVFNPNEIMKPLQEIWVIKNKLEDPKTKWIVPCI